MPLGSGRLSSLRPVGGAAEAAAVIGQPGRPEGSIPTGVRDGAMEPDSICTFSRPTLTTLTSQQHSWFYGN